MNTQNTNAKHPRPSQARACQLESGTHHQGDVGWSLPGYRAAAKGNTEDYVKRTDVGRHGPRMATRALVGDARGSCLHGTPTCAGDLHEY